MLKTNQINFQKICVEILQGLSGRQKQVIERRFGLTNTKPETLQSIGNDFKITRERVRQIESEAFSKLKNLDKPATAEQAFDLFSKHIAKSGGIKREDILLAESAENKFQNHILFLLTVSDSFRRFPETDDYFAFWANEKCDKQKINSLLSALLKKFEKENKPLGEGSILALSRKDSPHLILALVEASKHIEKGPLGMFGLVKWPEIKPRGVRDAAFVALKSKKAPLHFREIAEYAGELVGECFNSRNILPQTVHNELIRDQRFILVGRGIYALKEWGYEEGTVKDVIANVLRKAKTPLAKQKILEQVQKQRLVRANTILLNLSDKNYFTRNEEGNYILQEA